MSDTKKSTGLKYEPSSEPHRRGVWAAGTDLSPILKHFEMPTPYFEIPTPSFEMKAPKTQERGARSNGRVRGRVGDGVLPHL